MSRTVVLWVFVGLSALNALVDIALIGQEREARTPTGAVAAVIGAGLEIAGLLYIAGWIGS